MSDRSPRHTDGAHRPAFPEHPRSTRERAGAALGLGLLLIVSVVLSACGTDDPLGPLEPEAAPAPQDPSETANEPPTLEPIPDQTLRLNTRTPPEVTIELEISDPDDDAFDVVITSDDPAILGPLEVACGLEPCEVPLQPNGVTAADVTVTVAVTDGADNEVEESFVLAIAPTLVTTTAETGAGSLSQVVGEASQGDVIGFDADGVFADPVTLEVTRQIVIDRDLTIRGTGVDRLTLSGGGLTRVLRVEGGADVTVSRLTVAEGSAPIETLDVGGTTRSTRHGGGVAVTAASRLVLEDAAVVGSTAANDQDLSFGGGLSNVDATLVLRRTLVRDNQAGDGGGVGTLGTGASPAATTFEDGEISANAAERRGGGAYTDQGDLRVRTSLVTANTAFDGAGIASQGVLRLEPEMELRDNVADMLGGAVLVVSGDATLEGVTVEGNQARMGGGLYVTGTATVRNTLFEGNEADEGGAVFNEGSLEMESGTRILRNRADRFVTSKGGGMTNEGTATLSDVEIRENGVANVGGGIHNESLATLSLVSVVVASNSAPVGGGGIYNEGFLEIDDSTIRDNDGDASGNGGGSGGAILNVGADGAHAIVEIRNSSLLANNAASGGAILSRGSDTFSQTAQIIVDDSEIVDNVASGNGGGIRSWNLIVLRNVTVAGNRAAHGGGIYHSDSLGSARLFAGAVRDNRAVAADGAGGGVFASHSRVFLDGTEVTNNEAPTMGGGIHGINAVVTLTGAEVSANRSARGAGVHLHETGAEDAALEASQSTVVSGNEAIQSGGGIEVRADPGEVIEVVIVDTRIVGNEAATGAGIASNRAVAQVRDSHVGLNVATGGGGGIRILASNFLVTAVEVVGNRAGTTGGGVAALDSTLTFEFPTTGGCWIRENVVDVAAGETGVGGGIFTLELLGTTTLDVDESRVCDNSPDDIHP